MNLPKVEIYIETVILGAGKTNRGAGCAVLLLCNSDTQSDEEKYRKAVTWYAGQNVKQSEIVKSTLEMAMDALTKSCQLNVYSSFPQPSAFTRATHFINWQVIPQGSNGWQQRASAAAWEIALAGEVTEATMVMATTVPSVPRLHLRSAQLDDAKRLQALLDAKPIEDYNERRRCLASHCWGHVQFEQGAGVCTDCGLKQVYVAVDPQYLNLLEDKQEAAPTKVLKFKKPLKKAKQAAEILFK